MALVEGTGGGTTIQPFTLVRTGDLSVSSSVHWSVIAQGGLDAEDFVDNVLPSGVVTFAPGENCVVINVGIVPDSAVEEDETLSILLTDPSGCQLGVAKASIIIENDDYPSLSIATSTSVLEGNIGITPVPFAVTRSALGNSPTVSWVLGGSVNAADIASPVSGTVVFEPGSLTATIIVNVIGDNIVEPDEVLTISLLDPKGATLASPSSASITILNDDAAPSTGAVPVIATGQFGSALETAPIGTAVGIVTATGNPTSWEIVDTTLATIFAIAADGTVTTRVTLDFNVAPFYAIPVRASNQYGASNVGAYAVVVTDVVQGTAPAFASPPTIGNVVDATPPVFDAPPSIS